VKNTTPFVPSVSSKELFSPSRLFSTDAKRKLTVMIYCNGKTRERKERENARRHAQGHVYCVLQQVTHIIVGAGNAPDEPWFTWEMNVLSRCEHTEREPLHRPKAARDCEIVNKIMPKFYANFLNKP